MAPLNLALLNWERLYDTLRPHHSLDGRTPAEYLEQCHPSLVSAVLNEYTDWSFEINYDDLGQYLGLISQ